MIVKAKKEKNAFTQNMKRMVETKTNIIRIGRHRCKEIVRLNYWKSSF
jgi:hypothetical protein